MKLSGEVVKFLERQNYVMVTTLDKKGFPHVSCKGTLKVLPSGKIYLIDLYKRKTHENLQRDGSFSLAAVDEHRFMGFCVKGTGRIIKGKALTPNLLAAWEGKINSRLRQRVIRHLKQEREKSGHPELFLPSPEYVIVMEAQEMVDLTPGHVRNRTYKRKERKG